MCGGVLVHEVDGLAAQESANRGGECDLTVDRDGFCCGDSRTETPL